MGKFISLKYDFSFQHLFLHEEIRRHFISDVLDLPLEEIQSVKLANTFLWKQYMKQKQGLAQGRNEGEDRMNRLILSLISEKRKEDIEKAAKDKKYRERLYQKYGM